MTDIQRMEGSFDPPESGEEAAVLTGFAPVATMRSYPMEVVGYTRGRGHLTLTLDGYRPCHNAAEIIEAVATSRSTTLTTRQIRCSVPMARALWCLGIRCAATCMWTAAGEKQKPGAGDAGRAPAPDSGLPRNTGRGCRAAQIFERTYGPIKRDPLAAFRPVQSGNARILMPSSGKSCPNICWWTATISSLRGMS